MDQLTESSMYLELVKRVGGDVIIDDSIVPSCRKAIHDYPDQHGIVEPLASIDLAAQRE